MRGVAVRRAVVTAVFAAFAMAGLAAAEPFARHAARGSAASASSAPEVVSVESLLAELVDPLALARVPSVSFTARLDTSRDLASRDPADAATWFANADRGQFLRTERFTDAKGARDEWVLVDLEGPGAVVRLWTAMETALANTVVRIRLDGAADPVIEARFQDLLGGRAAFPVPLACVPAPGATEDQSASGALSYFPIPFASRCVISLDRPPGYWQVSSRMYAKGTAVEPLAQGWQARHAAAIAQAAHAFGLAPCATLPLAPDAPETSEGSAAPRVSAGGVLSHRVAGGALVRRLAVRLGPLADAALRDALREVWLEVDALAEGQAEPTACVRAPLGHFFGVGSCLPPVADRFREVQRARDGSVLLVSRLPMPAPAGLEVRLSNRGLAPVACSFEVVESEPLALDAGGWRLLHASFREDIAFPSDASRDWRMVELAADGDAAVPCAELVGTTLAVMNPRVDWWGEGDEKIAVDGEGFPSHFGTGSEDFIGCAWGFPRVLSSPLVSVALRDGASRLMYDRRTTVSRMRGLDGIPFRTRLVADIEWIPARAGGVASLAATSFWYAPAGVSRAVGATDVARMPPSPLPPNFAPIEGLVEAESLAVRSVTAGTEWDIQLIGASYPNGVWSNGAILFARPPAEGGGLALELPVVGDEPVRVFARFVSAPDYGTVRVTLEGAAKGGPISLRAAAVGPHAEVDLGVARPNGGRVVVRIESEAVGAAGEGNIFGVDGFRVVEP